MRRVRHRSNDPPQSTGSAKRGADDSTPALEWRSDILEIFPQTEGSTSRELGKAIRADLLGLNIRCGSAFLTWQLSPTPFLI